MRRVFVVILFTVFTVQKLLEVVGKLKVVHLDSILTVCLVDVDVHLIIGEKRSRKGYFWSNQ